MVPVRDAMAGSLRCWQSTQGSAGGDAHVKRRVRFARRDERVCDQRINGTRVTTSPHFESGSLPC